MWREREREYIVYIIVSIAKYMSYSIIQYGSLRYRMLCMFMLRYVRYSIFVYVDAYFVYMFVYTQFA